MRTNTSSLRWLSRECCWTIDDAISSGWNILVFVGTCSLCVGKENGERHRRSEHSLANFFAFGGAKLESNIFLCNLVSKEFAPLGLKAFDK